MLALGALEKPLPNPRPRPAAARPLRNGDPRHGDAPEAKAPLRRATSSKLPLSASGNGKASTAIPVRKAGCGSTADLPSAVSGSPAAGHAPARRTTSAGPGGAPVNGALKRRAIPVTPPKKAAPSSGLPRPKAAPPQAPAATWRELSVAAEHARPGGGQYRHLDDFFTQRVSFN